MWAGCAVGAGPRFSLLTEPEQRSILSMMTMWAMSRAPLKRSSGAGTLSEWMAGCVASPRRPPLHLAVTALSLRVSLRCPLRVSLQVVTACLTALSLRVSLHCHCMSHCAVTACPVLTCCCALQAQQLLDPGADRQPAGVGRPDQDLPQPARGRGFDGRERGLGSTSQCRCCRFVAPPSRSTRCFNRDRERESVSRITAPGMS